MTLELTLITHRKKDSIRDIDIEVDKDANIISVLVDGLEMPELNGLMSRLIGEKKLQRLTLDKIDLEKTV